MGFLFLCALERSVDLPGVRRSFSTDARVPSFPFFPFFSVVGGTVKLYGHE